MKHHYLKYHLLQHFLNSFWPVWHMRTRVFWEKLPKNICKLPVCISIYTLFSFPNLQVRSISLFAGRGKSEVNSAPGFFWWPSVKFKSYICFGIISHYLFLLLVMLNYYVKISDFLFISCGCQDKSERTKYKEMKNIWRIF